jgi:hypothetical protein
MDNTKEIKGLQAEQKKQLIELEKCRHKIELIKAKHTKTIWEDIKYDKYKTGKAILQNADLTISLAEDSEYQRLLDRFIELEVEKQCDELTECIYIDEPI